MEYKDDLEKAFSSDIEFQTLLKDGIFIDYFNTFLSLPIFAKRLIYRLDKGVFEIDPPVSRTAHHLLYERVVTWVRRCRGELFLKTSICNEYQLCVKLVSMPLKVAIEPLTIEETNAQKVRYLRKVIDMQRMKLYLSNTVGKSLLLFWLDCQAFRTQVATRNRRFYLKDIQEKYLNSTSPYKLNELLKESINQYIKERQSSCVGREIPNDLFVIPQEMTLQSFQEYWLPKYVHHRLRRRAAVAEKWGRIMENRSFIKKVIKEDGEKKDNSEQNEEKLHNVIQALQVVMAKRNEDLKNICMKASLSRKNSLNKHSTNEITGKNSLNKHSTNEITGKNSMNKHSTNEITGKNSLNKHSTNEITEKNSLNKYSTNEITGEKTEEDSLNKHSLNEATVMQTESHSKSACSVEKPSNKNETGVSNSRSSSSSGTMIDGSGEYTTSHKDNMENMINKLQISSHHRKNKRKKRKKRSQNSTPNTNEITGNNIFVSIRGSSADGNRGTTTDIQKICKESQEDVTIQHVRLPKLTEPYANQSPTISRKNTLLEAVYLEQEYEADTEEDGELLWEQESDWELKRLQSKRSNSTSHSAIHLPLIKNLSRTGKSVIIPLVKGKSRLTRLETPFNKKFLKENTLAILPERGRQFQILLAALTTDPIAGNPLSRFFEKSQRKIAEYNLKFWTLASGILSNRTSDKPVTRHRQYRAMINLYLDESAERKVSLPPLFRQELCDLLTKDLGITKLIEACDIIAEMLLPDWLDFLQDDEQAFFKQTTKQRVVAQRREVTYDRYYMMSPATDDNIDKADSFFDEKKKRFTTSRLWRAMELAISICKQKPEILPDTEENDTWTTDDDENENLDEGSLDMRTLNKINNKAVDMSNQEKLKGLFKNPYGIGLVHDYRGTSALFSKQFSEDLGNDDDFTNLLTPNEQKSRKMSTQRPPRPRCFQDILVDPAQFDYFKRFLQSKKEELPLLFWSAVESMRTATKSAKARQGRAHGIVKRYFGISTNQGKDLKCDADIIKEIPLLEKVTPAMLMSAQACVAKSMEENWFAKYLQLYQDDGGSIGVTLLPIYGQGRAEQVRSVKQKTRGLWRMFTRNVISFRRGIMNSDTLSLFREFLVLQHQLNLNQFQSSNEAVIGAAVPRIVVNNKLIYTDKLVCDLSFWSEVERYKDIADAVVLCAKLGNYTKDDELIVVNKAKTIVDCFIESQITPRIQINISNELAENIIHLVQNGIIERGLFHEAALSTFSTLIYFWKKFCLYRFLPTEVYPSTHGHTKNNRSAIIRQKEISLKNHKMKKVSLPPDEDCPKIMFSIQMGLRLALQRQGGRRKKIEAILEGSPQMGKHPALSPVKTPVFH